MYKDIKECNYCKKGFEESKLNKTNLGLICFDCTDIIQDKINKSDKPIRHFRQLLENGNRF